MTSTRIIAVLGLIWLTSAAMAAQLDSSDLDRARVYLQQTQALVIGATRGLTKEQWTFRPAPHRWSIAEIVEHIVLAQDYVLGPVRKQLSTAPAPDARDTRRVDEMVIDLTPDRTRKFQAPEFLRPTGRCAPAETLERLSKNYAELRRYLDSTPDLRGHAVEAPALKAISKGEYDSMDGYQAILLIAAHTERHTKQILEVRADAKFPVK